MWINSASTYGVVTKGASGTSIGYITRIGSDNKLRLIMSSTGSTNVDYTEHDLVVTHRILHHVILLCDRDMYAKFCLDGVQGSGKSISAQDGSLDNAVTQKIGQYQNTAYLNGGVIYSSIVKNGSINPTSRFNALAVLPFWSINYRDYPDNVTTYTDRFPHSSSIIASGAFKVDDDKIQCASAGTLTYSASHEFDGQEYITVTIAGTEYSGTGTITQDNTTVSVAQGSNKITVAMGTGDTMDKIRIQFRATV